MTLDEIQQIGAIASGVGAAVGGAVAWLVGWWWKVREQTDSIMVRFGPSRYEERPGFKLHVISRRAHKMELADFGFVLRDGSLRSVPIVWEETLGDDDSQDMTTGEPVLRGLNDRYEISVQLRNDGFIGAYARTTTQRRPTIDFYSDPPTPLYRRWWIRLQQRWKVRLA